MNKDKQWTIQEQIELEEKINKMITIQSKALKVFDKTNRTNRTGETNGKQTNKIRF